MKFAAINKMLTSCFVLMMINNPIHAKPLDNDCHLQDDLGVWCTQKSDYVDNRKNNFGLEVWGKIDGQNIEIGPCLPIDPYECVSKSQIKVNISHMNSRSKVPFGEDFGCHPWNCDPIRLDIKVKTS